MEGLLNCSLCGVEITVEEEARLNEACLPFDHVCHRCQCQDACPVCDEGGLYCRRNVDDWHRVGDCHRCNGTGLYDVYLKENSDNTFYPRMGIDTRTEVRTNIEWALNAKEAKRKRMKDKRKTIEVDLEGMESKQVGVFLPPLILARLDALVEATGMSKSQLVIEGLNDLCVKLGVEVAIKPRVENEGAE